jgi:hypothetical protein
MKSNKGIKEKEKPKTTRSEELRHAANLKKKKGLLCIH